MEFQEGNDNNGMFCGGIWHSHVGISPLSFSLSFSLSLVLFFPPPDEDKDEEEKRDDEGRMPRIST